MSGSGCLDHSGFKPANGGTQLRQVKSGQTLPNIPHDDSEMALIVQQEKLLKSAVSY